MRLTEQAQQTLKLAREEARNLNHNWIGTEHLLLGLTRHFHEGSPHELLKLREVVPNFTPESVRALVLNVADPPLVSPSEEIPSDDGHPKFTARMNLVLEDAWQISLDLRNYQLENEHLLLGAIYEKDGIASQVLRELGITYEAVYESVASRPAPHTNEDSEAQTTNTSSLLPPSESTRMTPGAVRMSELARQQAEEGEGTDGMLGTHHYLLALMMEGGYDPESSLADEVLDSFGITYSALESRIEELSISSTSDVPNWHTAPPAS